MYLRCSPRHHTDLFVEKPVDPFLQEVITMWLTCARGFVSVHSAPWKAVQLKMA